MPVPNPGLEFGQELGRIHAYSHVPNHMARKWPALDPNPGLLFPNMSRLHSARAAPNSRQLPPLHLSIPFPGQLQPSFTSSDFANILFSCSMADSSCQYLIWVVKKRVHVTSGIQEWQVGNVSAWLDFFFF